MVAGKNCNKKATLVKDTKRRYVSFVVQVFRGPREMKNIQLCLNNK